MNVGKFMDILKSDFYVGVPDSQLKPLIDCLIERYHVDPKHHIIAANEGNCVAIAAGYYLATGNVPVVYMQNSGEGNVINPVASLLNEKVYAIPTIFVIGWRGEPGLHDEPQHIFQGEVTLSILETMGIKSFVISKETTDEEVEHAMKDFNSELIAGRDVAFVIRRGALETHIKCKYENCYALKREEIIEHVVNYAEANPIVSTTGKASRELFEIREKKKLTHQYDFLTVGCMGHASSIALGIAMNKRSKVWCIDGDGAMLMHMGALAVIGSISPSNLVHIVINNGSHETVGGMPTVARDIDLSAIARACGYQYAVSVDNLDDLDLELDKAKHNNLLSLIEVKCGMGARCDLGRPTTTAIDNKKSFMQYISGIA